ncbi:uncharacterized protein VSU04_013371 [Chlamydotis macqueenii]
MSVQHQALQHGPVPTPNGCCLPRSDAELPRGRDGMSTLLWVLSITPSRQQEEEGGRSWEFGNTSLSSTSAGSSIPAQGQGNRGSIAQVHPASPAPGTSSVHLKRPGSGGRRRAGRGGGGTCGWVFPPARSVGRARGGERRGAAAAGGSAPGAPGLRARRSLPRGCCPRPASFLRPGTGRGSGISTGTDISISTGVNTGTGTGIGIDTGISTDIDIGAGTGIGTGISSSTDISIDTGISTDIDIGVGTGIGTGISTSTDISTSINTDTGTSIDTSIDTDTNISADPDIGVSININAGTGSGTSTGISIAITLALAPAEPSRGHPSCSAQRLRPGTRGPGLVLRPRGIPTGTPVRAGGDPVRSPHLPWGPSLAGRLREGELLGRGAEWDPRHGGDAAPGQAGGHPG